MLFNSFEFGVFFAVVLGLYWLLPWRGQNRLLLAASYFFYGYWDWRFLSLILISTGVDYLAGGAIHRAAQSGEEAARRKKAWLIASLLVNLGLLGVFKYYNFFISSVGALTRPFGLDPALLHLDLVLPVGISFYTFQTMSYSIDIYRGKLKPADSFFDFALFVSFFPQLVAGPIERASRLLPQICRPRRFQKAQFFEGLHLIFWGLFLKVFVADNLAPLVDSVYGQTAPGGWRVLLATYAFAFQIYGDFAGYSNIARGVAKCLGIEIMVNFAYPYSAVSIQDFWRRWHISLSTWLRDYLYIPLGGNRRGRGRTYYNLALTMLICGLWHGAAWTFVLWGAYHGALLLGHRLFLAGKSVSRNKIVRALKVVGVFHLVCLGWLIFRSQSLEQVWSLLVRPALEPGVFDWSLVGGLLKFGLPFLLVETLERISGGEAMHRWKWLPRPAACVFYAILFYLLAFYGAQAQSFIYFQF